ncbi:aspartate--tRNA ligase [candidate division WWE3 bacterium CG09_land_8_20_14_0_10_39_24]|uniref:Aspartate--tRNA(Asp/Asn) ligase n=2 Tax=Katanobacteria TaxID=422282 RepID=A0A2G9XCC6_UNCKA|nr:MAG: hypothetical protein AUJ94_01675 [bacterium CG2_30_40_12]OJI09148.1 MAG: hypothetical protein BK003_01140 [bacterium CG09_39_24]PIP04587.1 MAG: aspartate--tRNA ligase [candidate division WWE3 bacterium CG23_combo_of_CG06-09_8_20_14_all_40_14]PIS12984.1 MAG: aspartate--tRNA ligase [candidate division WWE3 bacterium CG09_land_8_20_14_0_10_39_24]PJE52262.1 MAG: aspartate--tRNA ligase [candidate division WWE3 bacterium CG10_big_fil_rev_8_21_14_0_10_39_14]
MQRTLISQAPQKIGQEVLLKGWVNARRDHGKITFIDLRDRTGIAQTVFVNSEKVKDIRREWVLEVVGAVKKRPEDMINPDIPTGKVEIEVKTLNILAVAEDTPFEIDSLGMEVNEELRLKYRYLDLRRPRLTRNLRMRHKIIKFIRDFLDKNDFVEIETPILTKATPEGARDFIVPSRLRPGNFYALPQSPQQYKQLLMVAGFEKYYQIARCFRDEDPRADRAYGEFTQLDIELSFPTREEILLLTEELYKSIIKKFFPEKKLTFDKFPHLSYDEVMKKYKTDKPDLRKDKNNPNELAFCFVVDFPLFEWKESENRWDSMHHPFTAPKEGAVPNLLAGKDIESLKALQYDFVLNGYEIGGGSIRITDPEIQTKIFEIMGHKKRDIEAKFGHLLEAFKYGVPPHGGIAPGIDRFLMIVFNEPSLREVIAFPTNSSGRTAVMDAPSDVDNQQLKELKLSVTKK